MSKLAKGLLTAAVLIAGIGLAKYAWHDLQANETTDAPAAAPAAVPVETVTVEKRPVRLWRTFSGRLQAVDEVELRPEVSGRIVDIRFEDGDVVRRDDVLFVIDPRPYEAAVAQARADLAAARDRRAFARQELERAQRLIKTSAISERVLDERANALALAESEVLAAEARRQSAEIDLDRAYVKAPISGRVSRAEVTLGNLVEAGAAAPVLTTIVSHAGIYAAFDVDEATYLDFVRGTARDTVTERAIPVRMSVGDGATTYEGRIHAFDNRLDPETATIRARALFDNEGGNLLPGMFAEVELGSATRREVILVRERAVLTDQDRKFVYVVGPENRAAYRQVKLGAALGDQRVVTSGLEPGDRVVVAGMMGVHPDMQVAERSGPKTAPKVAQTQ